VRFLVFDRIQSLDLFGPLEVLAGATEALAGAGGYRIEVLGPSGGQVTTESGVAVAVDGDLADRRPPADTVVVVGGRGARAAADDPVVVAQVARQAEGARRVASVCTGSFVLAAAGLLDGRRATTHWAFCHQLAERHPAVAVESDPIFVHDGPFWTSAGVTAGLDLALALVEDDHGSELARLVARWMVLFVQRPGGQAQFSTQLAAQRPEAEPLRALQGWIADHLDGDLSVAALSARVAMSPRHFARTFRDQMGTTPAAYVTATRLEAARRLLETTGLPVVVVARQCGFGTPETLHRSFRRRVGVAPGRYRAHFAGPSLEVAS
jgi:transcriptional regulator GlxA family with amidase domain